MQRQSYKHLLVRRLLKQIHCWCSVNGFQGLKEWISSFQNAVVERGKLFLLHTNQRFHSLLSSYYVPHLFSVPLSIHSSVSIQKVHGLPWKSTWEHGISHWGWTKLLPIPDAWVSSLKLAFWMSPSVWGQWALSSTDTARIAEVGFFFFTSPSLPFMKSSNQPSNNTSAFSILSPEWYH